MMNTQVSGSLDLHGMWTLCDYERANVEYACALSNHQLDENISRTCHIRTVSRSCEYACGFANVEIDEKLHRTYHIYTVSRSYEYACAFPNYQKYESTSRTHHILSLIHI